MGGAFFNLDQDKIYPNGPLLVLEALKNRSVLVTSRIISGP